MSNAADYRPRRPGEFANKPNVVPLSPQLQPPPFQQLAHQPDEADGVSLEDLLVVTISSWIPSDVGQLELATLLAAVSKRVVQAHTNKADPVGANTGDVARDLSSKSSDAHAAASSAAKPEAEKRPADRRGMTTGLSTDRTALVQRQRYIGSLPASLRTALRKREIVLFLMDAGGTATTRSIVNHLEVAGFDPNQGAIATHLSRLTGEGVLQKGQSHIYELGSKFDRSLRGIETVYQREVMEFDALRRA